MEKFIVGINPNGTTITPSSLTVFGASSFSAIQMDELRVSSRAMIIPTV
jgi:hypothetical protein